MPLDCGMGISVRDSSTDPQAAKDSPQPAHVRRLARNYGYPI